MFTVLSAGDGKYRVEDGAGTHVCSISGRSIAIRGFADEEAARDAALAGWGALEVALRQEFGGWLQYEPRRDRLRTVHDGAYEWLYDGTMAIARLLRPLRVGADRSFGIEFVLPSYASDGTAITAAHVIAHAVAPHQSRAHAAATAVRAVPRAPDVTTGGVRLVAEPGGIRGATRAGSRRAEHRASPDGGDAA
jgi:hypothetical protein